MSQGYGPPRETYDFVVIGSGFGGSVSAMRLKEKGYSVLVLERGKRYRDEDFARTNWAFWKYLWLPPLRCFGIMQISTLKGLMYLHGSGVGGGSLGYANVLEVPDDRLFANPAWKHLADWHVILQPHYETARRMLGVTTNPRLWPGDLVLREIAEEMGKGDTFRNTEVGVFFGEEEEEVPDPYFDGEGPPRTGCNHCGGCMVGCRYNSKNTLVKNYLYFAEQWGAEILPESEVRDIRPLPPSQPDGARYEVIYRRSTAWPFRPVRIVRARNTVVSAGTLGSLRLLFRCRDVTRSLPDISRRLGETVRTNGEALQGCISREKEPNYSEGISITSIFDADEVTRVEPVRYPEGSSFMRLISAPLISTGEGIPVRILKTLWEVVRHPIDSLRAHILPGWARRMTIIMVMQTEDSWMHLRSGRSLLTLFRRGVISEPDPEHTVPARIDIGHRITREFARRTNSIPRGTVGENLFNMPTTPHLLGGCLFGSSAENGVIDLDCQVHNYPGLYVVDGSIVPANPGVNPSLTITALAEYAMSRIDDA